MKDDVAHPVVVPFKAMNELAGPCVVQQDVLVPADGREERAWHRLAGALLEKAEGSWCKILGIKRNRGAAAHCHASLLTEPKMATLAYLAVVAGAKATASTTWSWSVSTCLHAPFATCQMRTVWRRGEW